MKLFWWQGGLHLEPESLEEGNALQLLWKSAKRTSIGAEGAGSEPKSGGEVKNLDPSVSE